MAQDDAITLFYCPQTRATGVRVLLEELGAPYTLKLINMRAGENRQAAYLAINPLGKVPAIHYKGQLTTEQVAIFGYLPDLFPEAQLAPSVDDPLRGPYLRWLAYYGSCYEPGIVDHYMKREPAPLPVSPYGRYDDMMQTIYDQLARGPYLLGERMTAADLLWGMALNWGMLFKMVPEKPEVVAFVERIRNRPSVARVTKEDEELAKQQEAATGAPPQAH